MGGDGRASLIDLSCAAPLSRSLDEFSGSLEFAPPEVKQGRPANQRADLFSLGKTLRSVRPESIPSDLLRVIDAIVSVHARTVVLPAQTRRSNDSASGLPLL